MRLATRDESRELDRRTQKDYGLSGELLMEAAGVRAAALIDELHTTEQKTSLAIIAGPGGNGGDALVVARHLAGLLPDPRAMAIYLMAPEKKRSDLFCLQLTRCQRLGLKIKTLAHAAELKSHTLVIDGLFGIGLRDDLDAHHIEIIRGLNSFHLPVVALDTPSGLDIDRGLVCGAAVRASLTIVFGTAKPGFFVNDGPRHVGRLRIVPIGFPRALMLEVVRSCRAFTAKNLRGVFPPFAATAHKTQHGHALIIAGRPGMWGASLLASSSAYRIGAGYVTLASFSEPHEVVRDTPEILTAVVSDETLWSDTKWTAAGIGPGLGTETATLDLVHRLMKLDRPCVIDADAITSIATVGLTGLPRHWVMTPHAGELSRVIGVDAKTIESDRLRYALEGSRKLGCLVLLKGFRTVLADAKAQRTQIIISGNSALGKAGTGDVLTGMITGLLAQKVPPWKAAGAAAYLHGRLADEWVGAGQDRRAFSASDLRLALPNLLHRLHGEAERS